MTKDKSLVINVRRILNPLNTSQIEDQTWKWQKRKVLRDYLQAPALARFAVAVNGKLIEEAQFDSYRLNPGDSVVVCPIPHGGGSGKDIMRLVAIVAVTYISGGIAAGTMMGGMFGAAGSLSAYAAATAVMIGGSMLINAVLPPVMPEMPKGKSGNDTPNYGYDGAKNTSAEGIPLPIVYGEHRVGGNIISMFSENTGDAKQYIYMLLALSEGPVGSVSEILINDRPLSDFGDNILEYQFRNGDNEQPVIDWFAESITPRNFSIPLSPGVERIVTMPEQGETFRLDLVAPQGIFDVDKKNGNVTKFKVGLEISVRKQGDSFWTSIGTSGESEVEISVAPKLSSRRVKVQTAPTNYSTNRRSRNGYNDWNTNSYRMARLIEGFSIERTDKGFIPEADMQAIRLSYEGYIGKSEFSWPSRRWGQDRDGTYRQVIQPIKERRKLSGKMPFELAGQGRGAVRVSLRTPRMPLGNYEFRIKRIEDYLGFKEPEYGTADTYLADINAIQHVGAEYPCTALLGLKILMNESISGVPNVTSLVQGKVVPIVTRNATTAEYAIYYAASANPAWVFLDLLLNERFGAGYDISRLDLPSFLEWADFCEEEGIEFNAVLDTQESFWDMGQKILRVGHAQIVGVGTRHRIVIERPSTPVMMFGMGNVNAFEQTWAPKADLANQIDITFTDKTIDYKKRTIKVVDEQQMMRGVKPNVSSISLFGVTDVEQAYREGVLILNMNRLLRETVTFSAPLEAIACNIGDVIYVQHDMTSWTTTGRLAPGSTLTRLKLDRPVQNYKEGMKILVLTSAVALGKVTISSVSGNFYWANIPQSAKDVSAIIGENGKEAKVTRVEAGEGFYLDEEGIFSAGEVVTLVRTDVIQEGAVTSYNEAENSVSVTGLVHMPEAYSNFMVGEVANMKKMYRVKSIAIDSIDSRVISAVEYNPEVYTMSGFQGFGSIKLPGKDERPDPELIEHVTDLTVEERAYISSNRVHTEAVARWHPPARGIYKSAEVYASVNGGGFQLLGKGVSSFTVPGQSGNTIKVKVVAVNIFGKVAPYEEAPESEVTLSGVVGQVDVADITGVAWIWQGRDCHVEWRYNSVTGSFEFGSEPDLQGAGAGSIDPHFKDYEITVLNPSNDVVRRKFHVTQPEFTYTYEMNFEDGLSRRLRFSICARDQQNNTGKPFVFDAENPAPVITQFAVNRADHDSASIGYIKPEDPDFVGVRVYVDVDRNNVEKMLEWCMVKEAMESPAEVTGLSHERTYFARLLPYDAFGVEGARPTPVFEFKTTYMDIDAIAEGVLGESKLLESLQQRINLIDGAASLSGSVNNRLEGAKKALEGDFDAKIVNESKSRASADEALAGNLLTLATRVGGAEAALIQESQARATADEAMANQISGLSSEISNAKSAIQKESQTRAQKDAAMAKEISVIDSTLKNTDKTVKGHATSISAINTSVNTIDGKVNSHASSLSTLSSTVGKHTTSISRQASTINGLNAQYTVKIDNNGFVTGFGLASTEVNGKPHSQFIVNANSFAIKSPAYPAEYPFTVGAVNGKLKTVIKSAMIGDADVGTLKIAGNAITVAEYAESQHEQTYFHTGHQGNFSTRIKKAISHPGAAAGGSGVIVYVTFIAAGTTGGTDVECRIARPGWSSAVYSCSVEKGWGHGYAAIFFDPNPPANPTYDVQFRVNDFKGANGAKVRRVTCVFSSGKR